MPMEVISMEKIEYPQLDQKLLSAIPELKGLYDKDAEWQAKAGECPGQYEVIYFVLRPFLKELLDSRRDSDLLKRVFDFCEAMARSLDIMVVNLLCGGVFEALVSEPNRLAVAWEYMGEEAKTVACRTAQTLHCEQNLPKLN